MGKYKNKTYNLRLDNEIMDKIRYIAEKECRPLSKQFELIVKDYLEKYENQNGNINIEINESTVMNNNFNIGK